MGKEKKEETEELFHVYQGKQPKYTGTKETCDAVAGKIRADAIAQGTDLSHSDHAVTIVVA